MVLTTLPCGVLSSSTTTPSGVLGLFRVGVIVEGVAGVIGVVGVGVGVIGITGVGFSGVGFTGIKGVGLSGVGGTTGVGLTGVGGTTGVGGVSGFFLLIIVSSFSESFALPSYLEASSENSTLNPLSSCVTLIL